ncbi:rhodanese-like domain-containing protein [Flavobacterium sp.]|uniref:rhodanese-like domain-containing protein n=1 Tax=Flavobacterium sp. TaxID=239 RepID=UPI0037A3F3C5
MENNTIVKEVCPTSTQELIIRGYMLLDIREPKEVEKLTFNVPKIIHIPLSELEERYMEVPKNEKIIVVCQTGERSLRAVDFLQKLGYTNLLNMKKGLDKWVQKGFPTIGDTSGIQEHVCCRGSHSHC